ncbi:MAG: rnhB [Herminiimonas sp.]|nr:rnhB [Herminiimonas sp.]
MTKPSVVTRLAGVVGAVAEKRAASGAANGVAKGVANGAANAVTKVATKGVAKGVVKETSKAASRPAPLTPAGRTRAANKMLAAYGVELETICGVDEAGRGPLAGPVFAAAVILDPARPIKGLRDSKQLTAARREELAIEIKRHALAWSIAQCSELEIDSLNILQATMLAMRRAVETLSIEPRLALIDGNRCPPCTIRMHAIVGGDDIIPSISAASILAKTARDAVLNLLHLQYPHYGFDQHKGYGTALHLERLRMHGVSPVHRKSYAPVRALLPGAIPAETDDWILDAGQDDFLS